MMSRRGEPSHPSAKQGQTDVRAEAGWPGRPQPEDPTIGREGASFVAGRLVDPGPQQMDSRLEGIEVDGPFGLILRILGPTPIQIEVSEPDMSVDEGSGEA